MTYTHITLVMDRSGSMQEVQSDAEGAVNHFLEEQKKVEGKASLLFTDFDGPHIGDDWFRTVHQGDLQDFVMYLLEPRGNTALLDAIGFSIALTNEFLLSLEDDEQPEKIIFVVQTDGMENSSREYKLDKLRELIKGQQDIGWEFVFLGMGPDTFEQGRQMGFGNVVQGANTGVAHGHTHSVLSSYVADYRSGHTHNLAAASYTVTAGGQVTDAEGFEIDPATGKRLSTRKVKDNPQA